MAVGSNPAPCTRKIGRAAECERLLTAWSERTRRFESSIFRHGRVTQAVECRSEKPMVTGSNPVPTTTERGDVLVADWPHKPGHAGSNPAPATRSTTPKGVVRVGCGVPLQTSHRPCAEGTEGCEAVTRWRPQRERPVGLSCGALAFEKNDVSGIFSGCFCPTSCSFSGRAWGKPSSFERKFNG